MDQEGSDLLLILAAATSRQDRLPGRTSMSAKGTCIVHEFWKSLLHHQQLPASLLSLVVGQEMWDTEFTSHQWPTIGKEKDMAHGTVSGSSPTGRQDGRQDDVQGTPLLYCKSNNSRR